MKTAFVHPWMISDGGAERVAESLATLYPGTDAFALFKSKKSISPLAERMKCSFLNGLPWITRLYQLYLPLYPLAVESLDLGGYDLVISSDTNVMKGVLVDQQAIHICYCHTPMRYVWDIYRHFIQRSPAPLRPAFSLVAHYLRLWDYNAAQRVDYFVANSAYIQQRIRKYYNRDSVVIYPPVDTSRGYLSPQHEDYYLSVGRLSATKRIDLLIQACNQLQRRLVIAGAGREEKRLQAIAGPTIKFLGRVSDEALPALYARCRAFLFAADEDFGIVPVEAQSYGRPVIAYGHGGSLETIRVNDSEGRSDTGVFFAEQSIEAVMRGLQEFESREESFVPCEIQQHARKFDQAVFVDKMRAFVDSVVRKPE